MTDTRQLAGRIVVYLRKNRAVDPLLLLLNEMRITRFAASIALHNYYDAGVHLSSAAAAEVGISTSLALVLRR